MGGRAVQGCQHREEKRMCNVVLPGTEIIGRVEKN